MTYLPVDPGFGFMKAIHQHNNQKVKFANIIGNYRNDGSLTGNADNLSISVEGVGAYNFGNTAVLQSSGGGSRSQSNNRIFTPEYLAGMLLAISEGYSKNTDRIEVDIITGLPGVDYNQYVAKDKAYQTDFKKFITGQYQIERPGYKQQITINSIMCTNQGWGAIYCHLIDKSGNWIKPDIEIDTLQIGNVNIGFNTIENGTVEVQGILNGSLRFVEARGKSKSKASGVHTIIDALIADLYTKFGIVYDTEKALSILETGKVLIDGELVEYQLPDDIKNGFGKSCLDLASQVWSDAEIHDLYRIVLTGGGANIVQGSFAHIPQLLVSDDPQWDTVKGYGLLIKAYLKGGK